MSAFLNDSTAAPPPARFRALLSSVSCFLTPSLFDPPPLRTCRRRGRPGILRPRMLRIAGPKFFPHFGIGAGPEAAQVARHLHGPAVRGEERQKNRHASRPNPRRVSQSKELLQLYRCSNCPVRLIVEARVASARDADEWRRHLIEPPALVCRQATLQIEIAKRPDSPRSTFGKLPRLQIEPGETDTAKRLLVRRRAQAARDTGRPAIARPRRVRPAPDVRRGSTRRSTRATPRARCRSLDPAGARRPCALVRASCVPLRLPS